MVELTVSIVSYNTKDLTLKCLESVIKSKQKVPYKILVIDNASSDGTVAAIRKKYPGVKVIENKENLGFGQGHNIAYEKSDTKYLLLLNTDTEIEDTALDQLVATAKRENYSILAPKLVYADNRLQPNFGNLPDFYNTFLWLSNLDTIFNKFTQITSYHTEKPFFYHGTKQVGWVSGAVVLINRDDFLSIGLFDPKIFMYAEDVDLGWKAQRNNLKVGWTDKVTILHHSGGSADLPHYRQWLGEFKGLLYLYRKYYGFLAEFILLIFVYLFIALRIVAFFLIGKLQYSKTYAKVITSI